jgi:demethylmenaquinone methyltransferase/2-methoxy-6-polyprenyl-1,4-benzoquinol methylase
MASPRPSLDKSAEVIRQMFGRVAPAYDRLNHLLSASLDRVWRWRLARAVAGRGLARPVLDLCCGTGDQAVALRRRGARVVGGDFCLPMLALARSKLESRNGHPAELLAADALALPFPDRSFGAVTVSFGLRNVADLDQALAELYRVADPGGALGVLEFALPRLAPVRWLYLLYFRHLLPRVGRLLSRDATAYWYLSGSVPEFPQRDDFVARLDSIGWTGTSWQDLSAGVVCLYGAQKPRGGRAG